MDAGERAQRKYDKDVDKALKKKLKKGKRRIRNIILSPYTAVGIAVATLAVTVVSLKKK